MARRPIKKIHFTAYRKRLRVSMDFKLEKAIERARKGEVRGLARTVGFKTDEFDIPSADMYSKPKDAFWGGIFFANPLVFNALGVTLAVGAATSFQKGLLIAIVAGLILLCINFLSVTLFRRLDSIFRLPAYVLSAALLLLPIGGFLVYNFPASGASLGIYLPLVSVCGLVIVRAESCASTGSIRFALADALGNAIGFFAVTLLIGSIRELIGSGKINGHVIFSRFSFPAAYLSFFPFLLLGVVSAVWQALRLARLRRESSGDDR